MTRAKKPRHAYGQHRERPPPPPAPAKREDLELVFGFRASLALIDKRPGDITRIACSRDAVRDVESALGSRADTTSISIFTDAELERITHSNQHEGLCVESRARRWMSLQDVGDLVVAKKGVVLALDRVRNSYNIGAILRTAAFFGVDVALLGAPAPHPGLDPNAVRVAEGGVEHLAMARTTDLADTLARLKTRGARVLGADGAATTEGSATKRHRPVVLVMGNEREGLGPRVRAQCDELVAIRGTGAVESLNVAVAAGVLIAELFHATKPNVGRT